MKTKNNKFDFFALISAISSIITIADFLFRFITDNDIKFSIITKIGIITSVISLLIFILKKNTIIKYIIIKNLKYFFHFSEAYKVLEKKSTYTFINKKEMEHTKKHKIKSNVAQLNSINDKFKWSKPQSEDEVTDMFNNISSSKQNHKISITRIENWYKYSVNFPGIGKGDTEDICVTIKNLKDPNEMALAFLSGNVTVKTKKLILEVQFKDATLNPTNVKYKIFNNYASEYPIITKELDVQNNSDGSKSILYTETKPIPGYRYVIYWDF